MATETLRPNAAGDETSWVYQEPSSGAHWDKVDEETSDKTTTEIYSNGNTYKRDLFNISNHSIGSGTINKITVYATCNTLNGTTSKAKLSIKSGGTVADGSEQTVNYSSGDWQVVSEDWTTDPSTSAAWTWDAIDALQIGINMKNVNYNYFYCTQAWVVVDYTPGCPKMFMHYARMRNS